MRHERTLRGRNQLGGATPATIDFFARHNPSLSCLIVNHHNRRNLPAMFPKLRFGFI
jgi:hypothetical protein